MANQLSPDAVSRVAGSKKQVLVGAKRLLWQDAMGDAGIIQPYIIPNLPINLWGKDLLKQMNVYMIKCKNTERNFEENIISPLKLVKFGLNSAKTVLASVCLCSCNFNSSARDGKVWQG